MLGAIGLLGMILIPIGAWVALRRYLESAGDPEIPSELPVVYGHWSVLGWFALLAVFNSWSGLQFLTLVYLVAIAAPAALIATFVWWEKRSLALGQRLTWWLTAIFAPVVALL